MPEISSPPHTFRIAIYARYSCEHQRETSIDDQVRRCKETAELSGLSARQWLIFTDSALSGQAYAQHKREGLKELEVAWHENAFDILMLDSFERLSRDGLEQERYIKLLTTNRRIRLITADGIDTQRDNWQLMLRLKGALAIAEISTLQHRVSRGMVGQLERGYMIAAPAFGYDLKREFDAFDNRIGSRWVINESEAEIVREIFARRYGGQSMHQIASWLNESGLPCSRKPRGEQGGFWRPSRIRVLLCNPIYRGEFVWHGSTTYKNEAERCGEVVVERRYARPELRLVSDELWNYCNSTLHRRSGYGGGKHALAGLVTCGCCGSTLAISAQSNSRSLYCANCSLAKRCADDRKRLSSTVAVTGVQQLLLEALQYFLTEEFVSHFRQALFDKLTAGTCYEYDECEKELKRLKRGQERLSRMLANVDSDDKVLEQRYQETRRLVKAAESRLAELNRGLVAVDEQAVQAQLDVDPAPFLGKLFDVALPPEQLREMLRRLFPVLIFEGKASRYLSFFKVRFAAGAALAAATKTDCQIDECLDGRRQLAWPVGDN